MMLRLSDQTENAILEVMRKLIDGGELRFYDLDPPPSASDSISIQHHLGTLFFEDATLRDFTIAVETRKGEAVADGRTTWARIYAKDGSPVLDCDVGEAGGGSVSLNSADLKQGGPIIMKSFLISIKPAE